jgi:hypothetical protein
LPVFIINGLFGFVFLMRETDQPSFILKLGQSHWQIKDLWLLPVLIVVGIIFSLIFKYFSKVLQYITEKIAPTLLIKVILGAILFLLLHD